MMGNDEASRFRELLAAERRSADLYDGLAEAANGERREILNQLAAVERRHAEHWAAKLIELGKPVPEPGSRGSRTRVFSWLARRFSIDAVLPYLERAERADAGMYQDDPEATSDMAVSERSHARVLTQLRGGDRDDRDVLRRSEPWHRGDRSGALRAGVFGQRRARVEHIVGDGVRRIRRQCHCDPVRRPGGTARWSAVDGRR
jgi:hypothetical protein